MHFDVRLRADIVSQGCAEMAELVEDPLALGKWAVIADGECNHGFAFRRGHQAGNRDHFVGCGLRKISVIA